jgi:hypothetical protein
MDKGMRGLLVRLDPTHRAARKNTRRRVIGVVLAAFAAIGAAAMTLTYRRYRTSAIEARPY